MTGLLIVQNNNLEGLVTLLIGRLAPAITVAALLTIVAPARAQYGAIDGEWRSYAGDNGSTKYSPLDQIDADNFSRLEIAWRVPTPDARLDLEAITEELARRGRLGEMPGGSSNPDYGVSLRLFKATPLMVGGLVFVPTPLSLGAAYDAGTGEERWVHDPESYLDGPPAARANMRGAAYWTDGNVERVYWGTTDGYLVSVDARNGEPAAEFGENGRVDLFTGVPRAERGTYDHRGRHWISVTSPPIVSNGVVVTPVTISDYSIAKEAPPGWVKGIDAITGDLRWVFRTVPRGDDFGAETWGNESWRYSGNTNVWAAMSADDELGYVGFLYLGLMLTADGPKVIEYNCRFGDPECQAVMPLVSGDLATFCLEGAQGTFRPELLSFDEGWSVGVILASAGYPASSHSGDVIDGLESVEGARVYHAETRRNEAGDWETNGGRVLAVVAVGADRGSAVEKAYAEAAKVDFDGSQRRSDIGRLHFE